MIVWICIGVALVGLLYWFFFKATKEDRAKFFEEVKAKIEGFVLDLILTAEVNYGSGTGQFKKAFVIDRILNGEFYKGLPLFIQKLITYDLLSGMIDMICETVFKNAQASNTNIQKLLK